MLMQSYQPPEFAMREIIGAKRGTMPHQAPKALGESTRGGFDVDGEGGTDIFIM